MSMRFIFPVSGMLDPFTLNLGQLYSYFLNRPIDTGTFYLGREHYNDGFIRATPLIVKGKDNKIVSLTHQDMASLDSVPILLVSGISSSLTRSVKERLLEYIKHKRKDYLCNPPKDKRNVSLIRDIQIQVKVDDEAVHVEHHVVRSSYCKEKAKCEVILNYSANRIQGIELLQSGRDPTYIEPGVRVAPNIIFDESYE